MSKQDALNWLNHRKKMCESDRLLGFLPEDVNFIRMYISHYKNKLVPSEEIIQSITSTHPEGMLARIDFMCNKLIADFDIKITFKKVLVQNPGFYLSIGESPFTTREVEFVEKYE